MIELCNKLVDNEKTRDELLGVVEVRNTTSDDLGPICETLARAFGLSSPSEALWQFINSNVLIEQSVKLVDRDTDEIYGILMFCQWPIQRGSPILHMEPGLSRFIEQFSQVNGHSFVIDKRLRGTGIDRKMLFHNIGFLSNNYDLIWIGVEKSLRTLPYWHRLGFTDVFEIDDATFLLLPISKRMIDKVMAN